MKKTKTGLHIDVKGKRIEVYNKKELEKLQAKDDERLDFVVVIALAVCLIAIGFIIGLSV